MAQLADVPVAGPIAAATLGAMAVAAVAISRLVTRRLSLTTGRVAHLESDDVAIRRRSRIREFVRDDVWPPSRR